MTVHFDLFCPLAMQVERACMHMGVTFPGEGCTQCRLTLDTQTAIQHGHLTISIEDLLEHPEFGVPGRRFTGTYEDDVGRLVVQRLIAWLHGHRDPLELLADAVR